MLLIDAGSVHAINLGRRNGLLKKMARCKRKVIIKSARFVKTYVPVVLTGASLHGCGEAQDDLLNRKKNDPPESIVLDHQDLVENQKSLRWATGISCFSH